MKNDFPFGNLKVGWLSFAGVESSVELNGHDYDLAWSESAAGGFRSENAAGVFTLSIEERASALILRVGAKLAETPESFRLRLLGFPTLEPDHIAGSGMKMGGCRICNLPSESRRELTFFYNCCLTKDGETVMVSLPLSQRSDNQMSCVADGGELSGFAVDFELKHNDLRELEFDPVRIESGDGFAMLREYADASCEVERDFSKPMAAGWNSWDYYRWTITEEEVLKNAEFIARDPVLREHVRRIIVDDGWQYCYGEWDANPNFPSGMKFLADRISALGFEPGLWFAPSIIEPHCRIAQMDYDMLAQSEGGQPTLCFQCMHRYGFVLDPTVEKSRKFLTSLFDRYATMGYKYFKLDFLGSTMDARRFADRSVPRSRVLRLLLDAVRAGVAGRSAILGCNYPYYSGNSYVESVRVGADIHALWESVKSNTASVAYMFWANKKLWINDPDFALCRGPETSDDPDLNRLKPALVFVPPEAGMTPNAEMTLGTARKCELEVLLSLDLMAGGAINLSDNLPLLNAAGLDLARKVVSAESGEAAKPLDLFASELPYYWFQKLRNGARMLVVNWDDAPREFRIDWKACGRKPSEVRDFWNGTAGAAPETVALEPHSCKLLEF